MAPAVAPVVLRVDDQPIRWRPGERLHHLFEQRCDELRAVGRADQLAVDAGSWTLTYDELDGRANQLARHLQRCGMQPGDRVALLLDVPARAYACMLAVSKAGGSYVPLDPGMPPNRLSFIAADAGVQIVVTVTALADLMAGTGATIVCVDELSVRLAAESTARLGEAVAAPPNAECYVIYTSGTTGRPKGVPIEHASICNFVRVAAEVYGYDVADRVYQGLTIAFDFSVEEIWVPLLAGSTLVPRTSMSNLVGFELHEFLLRHHVTAMCCVPTLLATLDDELPDLRLLLVSGEACPQDMVARWHRPGRRLLNLYGPTETTVTATWVVLEPGRPVTIGVPLPTYAVVVLDPHSPVALPAGAPGEIGIAGVCLSPGYLNRDELTEQVFVPDFLDLPDNPSARIYRTGDLGRINADGRVDYLGRIDHQVKIRGYRIELTEIESVMLQVSGVAQAAVTTYERAAGVTDLVGYYSQRDGSIVDQATVDAQLRQQLPVYMVPSVLQQLDVVPMLASGKVDRQLLPRPDLPRQRMSPSPEKAPTTHCEQVLADLLAATLGVDRVPVDAHLFESLGVNSLLVARWCALVRQRVDMPPVSTRDVYLNPTIAQLAAVLDDRPLETPLVSSPMRVGTAASSWSFLCCGVAQVLVFLGWVSLAAVTIDSCYSWVEAATSVWAALPRVIVVSVIGYFALCLLPVLAKWILIGRGQGFDEFPLWGTKYLRYWTAKKLLRSSPWSFLAGSPLYLVYLRLLGAQIGSGVVMMSRVDAVRADLLSIGDRSVISKSVSITCARAVHGRMETGPVTLGSEVFVGTGSVLDIDSAIDDHGCLAHASSLHQWQIVPAGESWHGSPAQPGGRMHVVEDSDSGVAPRGLRLSIFQIVGGIAALAAAIGAGAVIDLWLRHVVGSGFGTASLYEAVAVTASVAFWSVIIVGLGIVVTAPRLLARALQPDVSYPLYTWRWSLLRVITRLSNLKFFATLFGDSSYVVNYLQHLGYDLDRVDQTGSNFGIGFAHDVPTLSRVGRGTMVSDGLVMMNAEFSTSTFRVRQASIGAHNFLGNGVMFPAGATTADNCLLATKVMVPIDGPIRAGVGLLGSPCFEIPRTVVRDQQFDAFKKAGELAPRLRAKNAYNLRTMAVFLATRWLLLICLTLLLCVADVLEVHMGLAGIVVAVVIVLWFEVAFHVVAERAAAGFRRTPPVICSIYQQDFWRHERFWKLSESPILVLFNGTPMKSVVWRLLGARVGKRLYDDGCDMPERVLVTIGDDCVLNAGTTIQPHSLEDGVFKSEAVVIGDGCVIGVHGFVNYGVIVGDGAVLDCDAFLMKGERMLPGTRWTGNPARESTRIAVAHEVAGAGRHH